MKKIENRSGCCKYCKKADTCILSYIFPLGEMCKLGMDLTTDIYAAVEKELNKKGIFCTAYTDCCPYCKKHEDSGCYGEEE